MPFTLTFNPNNLLLTNTMKYFFPNAQNNDQTKDIFYNSTLGICKRRPPSFKNKLLTKANINFTSKRVRLILF